MVGGIVGTQGSEPKPVTSIVEVAKRAGVSVATVSRVMNDVPVVREETVKQVRAIMEEMGYKPAAVRRGPKAGSRRNKPGKTTQIGVLSIGTHQSWLTMPVFAAVVTGISRACRESEMRLLLDEMPDENEMSLIVRNREVSGLIAFVHSSVRTESVIELARRIPMVWVMGAEASRRGVDHVTADNIGVGYMAYEYLAKKGCSRLAFLAEHLDWPVVRLRGQAFINAAADAGIEVHSYLAAENPATRRFHGPNLHWAESLEQVIQQLARSEHRPDGLFIPTDLQTSLIHPLLIKHGLKPEKDIHLISCDNEQVRLSTLTPAPPSIDLCAEDIGQAALGLLVNRIASPSASPVRLQVSPRLEGF